MEVYRCSGERVSDKSTACTAQQQLIVHLSGMRVAGLCPSFMFLLESLVTQRSHKKNVPFRLCEDSRESGWSLWCGLGFQPANQVV